MEGVKGYDISGLYLGTTEFPESPKVLTRVEKGQALTHAEADYNLGSLLHTASVSKAPEEYEKEGLTEIQKEKRRLEQAGMFVTLSYAPILKNGSTLKQNDNIELKVQHSTDEVLEKIAGECVPGTLDVEKDLTARSNLNVNKNANVSESCIIGKDLDVRGDGTVSGEASILKDLYVHGNIYCDGVIYGNISAQPYIEEFTEKEDRWNEEHPRKSDARLKVDTVEIQNALPKLAKIRGYEFNWKDSGKHDVGVLAQEIQDVVPEAVRKGQDGYLEVCYTRLIPLMVQAIKELQQEVCELRKKQESRGN